MISLKSYLPVLADYLDLTPDALYERQRVLVRSGALKAVAGRGPGSGIRAMPATVTQLLIATLATDSLAETEDKTSTLGKGAAEHGLCPLTGANDFAGALELILSSVALAKKVSSIDVARSNLKATIYYTERGRRYSQLSVFGKRPVLRGLHRRSVEAHLPGQAVKEICDNLQRIVGDYPTKALFEEFEATLRGRRLLVEDR
ncbi:hypothetical protein BRDID11004_29080 [Bradyrhizobium diazoefficiens]|uniref:Uncharacterized protein n=1 Tax=Bradyrhizobium diazoefficiens TaxID=1355477 RepID=A0A810AT22_9BRAD|nr:hypothetical protein [Bradyrhizobium diazoefficiens]BBZ96185.1 hypothetical protein F07S3_60180 [Bradyrhizobium diazoefficiens]BCA13870.1 hypothetical protein BDHF08_57170 [Bradyrhizobium diazoefficiens]BCE58280.1 hypothetical protein XF5B_57920 [Bradyrhizobium diazoefficiens]BCE66957.1 hypothetical protein XF6B_57560 [Bradyrhizobium diazoefficiens]